MGQIVYSYSAELRQKLDRIRIVIILANVSLLLLWQVSCISEVDVHVASLVGFAIAADKNALKLLFSEE